ncbi:hypothetical protein C1H46_003959 [Malus baccata]|uniref:Uncharacterized protein n=1 Tax=Malus baccata TaxID=106549 RepID=A0A540NHK9_MALBA|nr:hypothetical protein C1H46_003959 [Malus baccata]
MIKLIISATALRNRTVQDLPAAVGEAVASSIFAASSSAGWPVQRAMRTGTGHYQRRITSWKSCEFSVDGETMHNSDSNDVKQDLIGDIMKNTNVQLALQDSQGTTRQVHANAICLTFTFTDHIIDDIVNRTSHQNAFPDAWHRIVALQTKISSMSRKLMGFNNKFRNSETDKKSPRIRCSLSKGKLSLATPTHSQNGSNSTADRSKMLVKSCHSFAGSVDGHKMPQGMSPCSSHVHPKLPKYDDLIAKLKWLTAEYRHRNIFSVF